MALGWVIVAALEWAAWRGQPHFGSGLPPRYYVPRVNLPPAQPLEQVNVGYPGAQRDEAPTWIASAALRAEVLGDWPAAGPEARPEPEVEPEPEAVPVPLARRRQPRGAAGVALPPVRVGERRGPACWRATRSTHWPSRRRSGGSRVGARRSWATSRCRRGRPGRAHLPGQLTGS